MPQFCGCCDDKELIDRATTLVADLNNSGLCISSIVAVIQLANVVTMNKIIPGVSQLTLLEQIATHFMTDTLTDEMRNQLINKLKPTKNDSFRQAQIFACTPASNIQ